MVNMEALVHSICSNPQVCRKFCLDIITRYHIPETEVASYLPETEMVSGASEVEVAPGVPKTEVVSPSLNEAFTLLMDYDRISQACTVLQVQPTVKYISDTRCITSGRRRTSCREQFLTRFRDIAANATVDPQDLLTLINHVSRWGFGTDETNIISECEHCEDGIFAFDHDYTSYCLQACKRQAFANARALLVTYAIDSTEIFSRLCNSVDNVHIVQTVYDMITDCQDQLPEACRGSLIIPLTTFVENASDGVTLMTWYYTVEPTAFTAEAMALALTRSSKYGPEYTAPYQKFFDEITQAGNVLVKSKSACKV